MPEIDWSKPIEVYGYNTGKTVADAVVMASDLKGSHPYVIRFVLFDAPDTECVEACSPCGEIRCRMLRVRNKPVVRRKYMVLSVTKAGGVVVDGFDFKDASAGFDNKEAAYRRREYRMSTGKYVVSNVVELEWTEE